MSQGDYNQLLADAAGLIKSHKEIHMHIVSDMLEAVVWSDYGYSPSHPLQCTTTSLLLIHHPDMLKGVIWSDYGSGLYSHPLHNAATSRIHQGLL